MDEGGMTVWEDECCTSARRGAGSVEVEDK